MFIFQLTLTEGTHAAHQKLRFLIQGCERRQRGKPVPIPVTADWNLCHKGQTSSHGHSESGLVWRSDPGWVLVGPKICPVYRFKDRHGRLISALDILRGSWMPMSQHTPSVDPRGRETGVPGNAPQWRPDISKEHKAICVTGKSQKLPSWKTGHTFLAQEEIKGDVTFPVAVIKNAPTKAI